MTGIGGDMEETHIRDRGGNAGRVDGGKDGEE